MAVLGVSLASVIDRLEAAGCVAAPDEAADLMAAAPDGDTLEAWIRRREQGEPLAWITGMLPFCGHTLRIDPGVYVPRFESEELARRAAALLASSLEGAGAGAAPAASGRRAATGLRAADLCTGAGAIAVHLMAEAPSATVVGVDIDRRAIVCARRNGVHAVVGDLAHALRSGAFNVVTAVAPYVPTGELRFLPADVRRYEPPLALDGGDDGLHPLRRIVAEAARLLRPGGWLLTEVGGEQDRALAPTLVAHGFGPSATWYDDDGDLRGLAAQAK